MDSKNLVVKDGDATIFSSAERKGAPSIVVIKQRDVKRKRRRGKSKRRITKPFSKVYWKDRRYCETSKRNNNRYRTTILSKTHAPFNNNQFLMEIHKPEPENNFKTSARTRDSSFSVESEDNYFYALPEDEEEYLTKEFSSVYEDAQTERLSNMSKNELIQEYLLLEVKYENLLKKRLKNCDEDLNITDNTSVTDKGSIGTDKNASETSMESSITDQTANDLFKKIKEQEEEIHNLQVTNEKLKLENDHLRQQSQLSSSEDSESDSTSSSGSCSSSSCPSPYKDSESLPLDDSDFTNQQGDNDIVLPRNIPTIPLTNGYENPNEDQDTPHNGEI